MKRDGRRIVAVVLYDYQMAQIADRAGVDVVSVGDSIGINLWGLASDGDVTLDQMLLACRAVRRGVSRALVSCDMPASALGGGVDATAGAARRLVDEGGAEIVKIDADTASLDAVRAAAQHGVAVWAQIAAPRAAPDVARLVARAQALEAAGAALIDFRYSGPVAGPAVAAAVGIPVLGGLGGGPWLDGRVRALVNAIGYLAAAVGDTSDRYANVADTAHAAITSLCDDVRGGRQIRGG